MGDDVDKYADDGEDLTQVRSIIKQLNEDKPSKERSREVVTRADGSKVVRVTKKRKVMLTSADKRRRSRRQILYFLLAFVVLVLLCGAFMFYRMATMSSSSYMDEKRAELQQLWGATSVQMEGAGVEGTTLSLSNVVAEFPEDCVLQRIELSGVQADLELVSFIGRRLRGSSLNVERAVVVLRNGRHMDMPRQTGADLWDFARMDCKDFSVVYAESEQAPVSLRNANAYMYYPSRAKNASVVMFRGGTLDIKGWKTVTILEGKAHVSTDGVDDFSFSGTTDTSRDEAEQRRTKVAFAGKLPKDASMAGPFSVEADNMSLADFTDGRFEGFFTARTTAVSHGRLNGKFFMELVENAAPRFAGKLHLRNICLSSFPALMSITEHMEHGKRRLYNPLLLHQGYVRLDTEGDSLVVEIPEGAVAERDLATLTGKMVLSAANELSGELSYGIPVVLTRVEYPDGQPDPIFQQNGEWAVLRTQLSGRGNMPGDDMAIVEARAEIARRDRPARIPFDQLDVNRLTEQILNQQPSENQPLDSAPAAEPVQQPSVPAEPLHTPSGASSNPFETSEDPFAPSAVPF